MQNRVVTREAWLQERIELLKQEKELTRQRDSVAARVREMPWVKVDKQYTLDSPDGPKSLSDLFGDKSQLIVYHFMFDPTWSQGCASCSFIADSYSGLVIHLAHRDIAFATVSKASIGQIEVFRKRMGWTFPWYSGETSEFGKDFGVSFTDEELLEKNSTYNFNGKPMPVLREHPGLSVFHRDANGEIYNTYSTFARGLETFLTAYRFIDITPKGRDEAQTGGMGWLRHHDRYDAGSFVAPWAERPGITSPIPGS